MFTKSSRYYGIKFVETLTDDGRKVNAVSLRRILPMEGQLTNAKGNDRLDIIALDKYKDPTMFWYIADANTDLQANDLVKRTMKINTFKVPSS
jgi:histidinol phosphatase-like enzyme